MLGKAAGYAAYQDKDAKTLLVEQHAPLVKRIALHLMARLPASVQLDDLLQSGMIGLLEAASKFDGSKGAKFETFAGIRIRGAMLDEMRRGDWVPRSVHRNSRLVGEALESLEQQLGREPTDNEVAAHLNMSANDYHAIVKDVAVGKLVGIEDLGTPIDTLASAVQGENSASPTDNNYDQLAEERFSVAMVEAIKALPERDALVLSLYYDEALNLKEIGAVLEVSESRVSQILSQAMARLKTKLRAWTQT
ncbi:RNA polymerase sigma factor FliA [Paraferrimonas sedimenticola]|uniref:RNA polymerase sigma factor FliA n=1 Tax=Paraferrimonas sedimenticola TaxID=375674 RepID=A0AA37RUQ4_9GAMM|nr:RNA polymerase sigma factor FliA [Paraferrimonas sedimenticola]GLP94957.1 RNA polymerase sigma factor FliA [Paraferrimonas sedimenticola]